VYIGVETVDINAIQREKGIQQNRRTGVRRGYPVQISIEIGGSLWRSTEIERLASQSTVLAGYR